MTSRDRTLTLKVIEDVSSAAKGIESLDRKTSRLGGAFKKAAVAGAALFAADRVLDFGKNVLDAGATVAAFEDTARTVFANVGDEAVAAAEAAQGIGLSRRDALQQLNYFGNLATATGSTAEEALALATSTQQLGADLAAFTDVPTADVMEAIASATRGEYDALQRYLPTVSARTLEEIALTEGLIEQGEALDAVTALQAVQALALRDGGAAIGAYNRESDSLQATTARLSARWENFQATLGKKVLPLVERAATWFEEKLLPAISDLVEYVQKHWPPIYEKYIKPTMEKIGKLVTDTIALISEVWAKWGDEITEFFATWGETVFAAAETVIEVLTGIIDFLTNVFQGDWAGAWEAILGVAETLVDWFTELPGRLLDLVGPIITAIASVGASIGKALVNGVIRAWNALDPSVGISVPSWIPGIGGSSWNSGDLIPDIPYLARGGIVTGPTLAMIGERGAEAVIPLDRGGYGTTYNLTVEAGVSDPAAVAEAVVSAIEYYEQTNGAPLGRG